jgi:hypothetical protein
MSYFELAQEMQYEDDTPEIPSIRGGSFFYIGGYTGEDDELDRLLDGCFGDACEADGGTVDAEDTSLIVDTDIKGGAGEILEDPLVDLNYDPEGCPFDNCPKEIEEESSLVVSTPAMGEITEITPVDENNDPMTLPSVDSLIVDTAKTPPAKTPPAKAPPVKGGRGAKPKKENFSVVKAFVNKHIKAIKKI